MWNDNDKILGIFDKANEGGMQFPCQCPVCQKHSAHIYIHRHNNKHCGIWTWCNECGASAHLSGQTPSWWVNPDFVDAGQLCSDPSYLDEIADQIDKWVNSLVPAKNTEATSPFVMKNRFDVILKEELQGIPAGTSGTIAIRDDFKTMKIDFIGTDGKTVRIHESPEKILQVVEVVTPTDNGLCSKS